VLVEVSAVIAQVSDIRAAIVYGQLYLSGADFDSSMATLTRLVLADSAAILLPTQIRRTHGSPPSPAPLRPEDTGRGSGIFSA